MSSNIYQAIVNHYETCLDTHGDSYLGVNWPSKQTANIRYKTMIEVVKTYDKCTLLDFGCGLAHLNKYIIEYGFDHIQYSGLDISEKFTQCATSKYPDNAFYTLDVLAEGIELLPDFDYIVFNGVFTVKMELAFDEMLDYLKRTLCLMYQKSKIGMAFNVMSPMVDYEEASLFYVPFDVITTFLAKELSRNFIIRHEYGLYEYTVYVYRARE